MNFHDSNQTSDFIECKTSTFQERVEPAELGSHLIKKHVNAKSKKLSVSSDAALKSSSSSGGEVLCDICGKVLSNKRWKRIHMKYNHPGEEDEVLNIDESFYSSYDFP